MTKYDRDERKIRDAFIRTQQEPPELVESVLAGVRSDDKPRRKSRLSRPLLVAIILLCILATVAAALVIYSSYQRLLENIDPEYAQVLTPLELATEDQGIRFELVAYTYVNDRLIAYVTLEDTTSQGRVNEDILTHMDLFYVPGAAYTSWRIVYYDEETGILTYHITAGYSEGEELTIEFNDLYFQPVTYEAHDTGIDLTSVGEEAQTIEISGDLYYAFRRYGPVYTDDEESIRQYEEWSNQTRGTILYPGAMELDIPDITQRRITNIGVVEDKLRVQIWADIDDYATVYRLYLQDIRGETVDGKIVYTYGFEDGEFGYYKDGIFSFYSNPYWEWEFDVSAESLADYRLLIDITESPSLAGDWTITVPLAESTLDAKSVQCDFVIDNITIESAVVTPLGISLYGTEDIHADTGVYSYPLELDLGDEIMTLTVSRGNDSYGLEDGITLTWGYYTDVLIDVDRVLGFTIEGIEVTF